MGAKSVAQIFASILRGPNAVEFQIHAIFSETGRRGVFIYSLARGRGCARAL